MNRWRNTLASAALLLGRQLHAAGQAIVDITENDGVPAVNGITGEVARLAWDYNVQNNANIVTNWNEWVTQVKLYDLYSAAPPVPMSLSPNWGMGVLPGSASNYWDVTLTVNNYLASISPNGNSKNFSIATYIPTNALNRLVVGTRRGQGYLESHLWQPGGPSINRIAGDGFVGPVGLAEEVRPVVVGLDLVGATAVVAVSNTLAGALYEMQTATNGLAGGWSAVTNVVAPATSLTLTGTVQNATQQFWRVKGPL